MMPPESKFAGILRDLNLEIINEDLIKELIAKKIYFLEENNYPFTSHEYENSSELDLFLCYNHKHYFLNEQISNEIYEQLEFFVENAGDDFEYYKKSLLLKLDAYLDKEQKIDFLKKLYKKHYKKFTKNNEVLIFLGQEDNGFSSWKDLIIDCLSSSLIKSHLQNEISQFNDPIVKRWTTYKLLKELTDLYVELIQALENNIVQETEADEILEPVMAKSIALLHEIGFFELEKYKSLRTFQKQKLIVAIITGVNNTRGIEGNIRVLDPHSKEDRSRYTSFTYLDEMRKLLK